MPSSLSSKISRIRLECSSLNAHLFNNNIVNNALCSCCKFESLYPIFFYTCSNYRDIKSYLRDKFATHSTHALLFGRETGPDRENESLFLKVHGFIIKSKRSQLVSFYRLQCTIFSFFLCLVSGGDA